MYSSIMECQVTNKKKVFLFVLIFVFIMISMILYFNPSYSHSLMVHVTIGRTTSDNSSASNSPYPEQHFEEVMQDYKTQLSLIENPKYTSSGQTQCGPPIQNKINSGLEPNVKRILLWTEFFGIKQWIPEMLCSGQNKTCQTSLDKNDILKSDGVLIHPRDISKLPTERHPSQRWIYFIQESPYATGINPADYNSVFNWTATYRLDSDLPASYYQSAPLAKNLSDSEYEEKFTKILTNKKKLAFAAISNCDKTHTNRIPFIKELQKYMTVDFYGDCGNVVCSKKENCSQVFSEYKFYLSFENSNCREYITEKVRNPLHLFNSVPVVMGGAHPNDYFTVMPPDSFIHYQGFASVKDLAEFILFLDRNDEIYERYHRWRQTYAQAEDDYWCSICQALHNKSLPSKVYTDFEGWYDQDICNSKTSSLLPNIIGLVVIMFLVIVIIKLMRVNGIF